MLNVLSCRLVKYCSLICYIGVVLLAFVCLCNYWPEFTVNVDMKH